MKLNITIDVQDIFKDAQLDAAENPEDSGYDLRDCIKQEIIHGVKNSISSDCMKLVKQQSSKAIEQAIADSVEEAKKTIQGRALEFVNEWLEKKTVISDKWGDPVNELTISELIKQQFDNLLERKVNERGEFSDSYGGKMKLINYLTGAKVQAEVSSRLKDFSRDVDQAIKAHIEAGIKEQVSNKFAEMVIQTAKSQNKLEQQ